MDKMEPEVYVLSICQSGTQFNKQIHPGQRARTRVVTGTFERMYSWQIEFKPV